MNTFQKNILSFFGSGLSPWAPGTMGSFAACGVSYYLVIYSIVNFQSLLLMALTLFVVGTISCYFFLKKHPEESDPRWIVIDEAAAVILGMGCIKAWAPSPFLWQTLFFVCVFRLFDIFKPWPISWAENTFKGPPLKGAFGIMVDDLIAGIFALIVCFFVKWFLCWIS